MIIHKITNKLNNKVYIGLTTQSLEKDKVWTLNGNIIDINCYNYNPVSTISESGE